MYWSVAKEISFKELSNLNSGSHVVQRSLTFDQFGRGHHEDHFCEIILNFAQ